MIFLKKVLIFWLWTTCDFINQIESQYNYIQSMPLRQHYPLQERQQQQPIENQQRQQRTLIKISTRGFLPFENDIIPFAVLQRILNEQQQRQQEQQQQRRYQQYQQQQQQQFPSHIYSSNIDYNRGGRYMQWQTGSKPKDLLEYAKNLQKGSSSTKVRATIKNLSPNHYYHHQQHNSFTKQQPGTQYYYKNPKFSKATKKLKLERTSSKLKHYKLYDADGEYLLDLRYHNNNNNNNLDEQQLAETSVNEQVDDNKSNAEVKMVDKMIANNNNNNQSGIGTITTTTTNDDSSIEKASSNYYKSNINNNNNNKGSSISSSTVNSYISQPSTISGHSVDNQPTWQMSFSTLSKANPIVVADSKPNSVELPTMLPTSPTALSSASASGLDTSKRVQHIWLHV